jgi:hypothetical protein
LNGLLYTEGESGQAIFGASAIRDRRLLIEHDLLGNSNELFRILAHEIYHFVWARLGNPWRWDYEGLLVTEMLAGARGELGWSSESRKRALTTADWRLRGRKWREYACESFCDTAAWWLGGAMKHAEVTLAEVHRKRRAAWSRNFHQPGLRIAL